jgi:hypothetical protein
MNRGGYGKLESSNLKTNNIKLTPEGGFAIKMINNTGAVSVKGNVVLPSTAVDNGVILSQDDIPDPIGIMYEGNIQNGDEVWVVVGGIADVLYGTAVSRGTFARTAVAADGVAAGLAVAEALPAPPFATNKHFQEIGHPIQTIAAPGLAKTVLHFN